MSSLGKIHRLLDEISAMPGATHTEQQEAYADLVEARLHALPAGNEWNALMCLLGHLRGGMRRFERDFPIDCLPLVCVGRAGI